MKLTSILSQVCFLPEVDPDSRMGLWVVCLEVTPGRGVEKGDREGKKGNQGCSNEQVTHCGNWGWILQGNSQRLCGTCFKVIPMKLGNLLNKSHLWSYWLFPWETTAVQFSRGHTLTFLPHLTNYPSARAGSFPSHPLEVSIDQDLVFVCVSLWTRSSSPFSTTNHHLPPMSWWYTLLIISKLQPRLPHCMLTSPPKQLGRLLNLVGSKQNSQSFSFHHHTRNNFTIK